MSYPNKFPDQILEQALQDGHLPGEEGDFFTEDKMKEYFQEVVVKEFDHNNRTGGGGINDASDGQFNGQQQDIDQDEQAPEP